MIRTRTIAGATAERVVIAPFGISADHGEVVVRLEALVTHAGRNHDHVAARDAQFLAALAAQL
jgi:hypothetical protein